MTFAPVDRSCLVRRFTAAAEAAAAAIMAVYGATEATAKADGSPLTAADLAAHEAILAALAQDCPGLPVVSEEDAGDAVLAGAAFVLVDPLDGTREFLSRNGEFTVNIALIEAGRATAGIVLAPALGRAWRGVIGEGAERRDADVAGWRPIATRPPPADGLVAVASRSHRDPATEAFLAARRVADLAAVGSSLKFCLVAEGRADVYPRFGPTMEWDTAAGQAVLEAAGGAVLAPDGAPFRYGKPGWRNGPFIAWGAPPAA